MHGDHAEIPRADARQRHNLHKGEKSHIGPFAQDHSRNVAFFDRHGEIDAADDPARGARQHVNGFVIPASPVGTETQFLAQLAVQTFLCGLVRLDLSTEEHPMIIKWQAPPVVAELQEIPAVGRGQERGNAIDIDGRRVCERYFWKEGAQFEFLRRAARKSFAVAATRATSSGFRPG